MTPKFVELIVELQIKPLLRFLNKNIVQGSKDRSRGERHKNKLVSIQLNLL